MKEITLDKELGGKPLTEELWHSLTPIQLQLLEDIDDQNNQMTKACEDNERAEETKNQPEFGISDNKTIALIISDIFEIKQAKIREEIQNLLKKAVEAELLGTLAVIQRMCQRYGLSDYIRSKIKTL